MSAISSQQLAVKNLSQRLRTLVFAALRAARLMRKGDTFALDDKDFSTTLEMIGKAKSCKEERKKKREE